MSPLFGRLRRRAVIFTAECSEYKNVSGGYEQDGRRATEVVFSANHQSPGAWTEVGSREYASGVMFETNPSGAYVKLIRLLNVSRQSTGLLGSYSNPGATPWVGATGFGVGRLEQIECPDQYVVTSLSLRYDESNGKLRNLKIGCRHLVDD